jgi:2-polyprenyl-3-methyl-5-hydroxy-6-metoxy-1,4-benzoquinol methylase
MGAVMATRQTPQEMNRADRARLESYLDRVAKLDFGAVNWTRERIAEVRDLLSPWNHNIALPHGVYTAACDTYYPSHREIMRVVADHIGGDFDNRRVLDIGCLEGYFSIECALQGASVVGVDGKVLNLRKCEFVRSVLGVDRARFVQADAMTLTRDSIGAFDVVLALGLLYHLRDPHRFLANVAGLCDGFAVIDTHIAFEDQPPTIKGSWAPELSDLQTFTFGGHQYEGRLFREFPANTPQVAKDLSPTASLDNELSRCGSPRPRSSGCCTMSALRAPRRSSFRPMRTRGGPTCAARLECCSSRRRGAAGFSPGCFRIGNAAAFTAGGSSDRAA